MKQTIQLNICMILILVFLPGSLFARDFIVQFLDENYKQTNQEYSYFPQVYHSIQVMTDVTGPKLLVLSGDDHEYRTWLRQFIASGNRFIVKVPDTETDLFISSMAYVIDVTAVHPFNHGKWQAQAMHLNEGFVEQNNCVLVVDANEKRSQLIALVINNTGYKPVIMADANHALKSFQHQPDKYDMIILDHEISGLSIEEFVRKITAIDRYIPVIIGSGYKNPLIREKISKSVSAGGSVVVVPVILNDLKNRIQKLLKQEA